MNPSNKIPKAGKALAKSNQVSLYLTVYRKMKHLPVWQQQLLL